MRTTKKKTVVAKDEIVEGKAVEQPATKVSSPASKKDAAAKDTPKPDVAVSDEGIDKKSDPVVTDPPKAKTAAAEATDKVAKSAEAADVDTKAEKPEPATPAPAPEPAQAKGGSSFIPLVLGGLVAGGIGYAIPTFINPPDDPTAALTAQIEDVRSEAQAAREAADAIELPDLAPLRDELAALSERADTLSDSAGKLDERLAAIEARPVGESGVTEGDLATLRQSLEQQTAASAALAADLERMREMQAEGLANAETEALEAARAAQEAASRQSLQAALQSGAPFTEELAGLQGEVPQALIAAAETGVPTQDALTEPFPELARAALGSVRSQAASEGSTTDRLGAFLSRQLNTRSVEPREGDDPDAVLSRAEAAVRGGDLDTALQELDTLPDSAKAPLADWISQARLRADAVSALNDYLAAN